MNAEDWPANRPLLARPVAATTAPKIAGEVETDPQLVKTAPHSTRTSRVDETTAARKPVLRWKPA